MSVMAQNCLRMRMMLKNLNVGYILKETAQNCCL